MTENEAIKELEENIEFPFGSSISKEATEIAISALQEIQKYQALGTVEELSNAVKGEDVLKFYYCESEDDYYIGRRIGTMYYAKYGKTGFTWFMSKYLPWGKHVIEPNTLWKEHTHPSEPKEIPFFEWLTGFLKKHCGGTLEELWELIAKGKVYEQVAWERNIAIGQLEEIGCSLGQNMDEVTEAMEKQMAKKPIKQKEEPTDEQAEELVELGFCSGDILRCPCCGEYIVIKDLKHCMNCGQSIDFSEVTE